MDQQQRPKIDIAKVISDFVPGATIVGPGSKPNTVKIKTGFAPPANTTAGQFDMGDEEEHEIDTAKLMADVGKQEGFDPAAFDIQIGSRKAPVADNPMGIVDRFKYEIAHTQKDKAEFLKNKFGAENMHFDSGAGQFRIKKDNTWYNAEESGLAGYVGKEGDVTAGAITGGIAGVKGGAALGSLAGPIGTAIGAAVGGIGGAGLGAVVSRLGTMEAAKSAGLRTEQDAGELQEELADEFVTAAIGETIGLGVVKAPGATRAAKEFIGNKLGKLGKKVTSDAGREQVAALMQQMTDVPKADNMTWMEPENFAGTKRFHEMAVKYEQTAPTKRGQHPVTKELGDEIQNAVESVKKHMYEDFEKTMEPVKHVTKDLTVDVAPVVQDMHKQFVSLGLVDANGKWLGQGQKELAKVVNPASVRRLKQTYEIINRGTSKATKEGVPEMRLPFDDVQTLVRNTDEILEAAGQFNLGPQEITTPARAQITGLRRALRKQQGDALAKADESGKLLELFTSGNAKFSKRREWIDEIAGETSDLKIEKTMKKLFDENNSRQRQVMSEIMDGANIDSQAFINKLFQGRAAMNSVNIYKAKGSLATIGGAVGYSSPRKATPLASRTFNKLHKMAAATQLMKNLTPAARQKMLGTPEALQMLNQTLWQAYQAEDQVPQMLTNEAMKQSEPVK